MLAPDPTSWQVLVAGALFYLSVGIIYGLAWEFEVADRGHRPPPVWELVAVGVFWPVVSWAFFMVALVRAVKTLARYAKGR